MKIDVLCSSGSPMGITPDTLYGRGVGGAEYALISLAEALAARGHNITIYNNPKPEGVWHGVNYKNNNNFEIDAPRDAFIVFKSRNPEILPKMKGLRIFWSCDQFTEGNFDTDVFPYVDKIVCISTEHMEYFKTHYAFPNTMPMYYIDLGVRQQDYDFGISKNPNQAIFCSVPDRGLKILKVLWPEIVQRRPESELVITADYRLWGIDYANNTEHKLSWFGQKNVKFKGKVDRLELTKLQMESAVHLYPCSYQELFCIALAETQVAGAVPVYSTVGAIKTTGMMGYMIPGDVNSYEFKTRFIESALKAFDDSAKHVWDLQIAEARKRFDWNRIAKEWEEKILK